MSRSLHSRRIVAQLEKLDQELTLTGRVDFVLLAISTLAMATARYWLIF